MSTDSPKKIAHDFVDRINAHDVDRLCALMTEDHLFVDSRGTVHETRETMREAWRGYFGMFPDYQISIDHALSDGETVVLLGSSRGTYATRGELRPENLCEGPAAWRAKIRNGAVCEWQVYADNSQALAAMERSRPGETR